MEEIVTYSCEYHLKDWFTAIALFLGIVVYPGIEFWLGRTKKTRAASVLEFLLLPVFSILSRRKSKPVKLLTGHVDEEYEMNPLENSLAGREIDKKIGTAISVFVDVKPDLKVDFGGTVDGLVLLHKLAEKSSKSWLKFGVDKLTTFLGLQAPAVAGTTPAPATEPDSDMAFAQSDVQEEVKQEHKNPTVV